MEKLKIKEFEFIDSGLCKGSYNMDFDTARAEKCVKGELGSMFRLYGWSPWAVSLGANQNEEDIDRKECEKRGFDIVRRPTGGRAVLHANEITYSVVTALSESYSQHDAYRDIHLFLLDVFTKAGCSDLDFERSQSDLRSFYKESGMSVSCFASSARYEITYQSRKVVGSAQRLYGDVLLQHGSILLDNGHEQLAYISANKSDRSKEVLKNYIEHHSATLSESARRTISYSDIAEIVSNILNK
jgi:lipoyl(octanoyl) transferase